MASSTLRTMYFLVCAMHAKLISFDGEFDAVYDALSRVCRRFVCATVLWFNVFHPSSEDQTAEARHMQARVLLPVQPGSSPKPRSDASPRETQLKVRVTRHFTTLII